MRERERVSHYYNPMVAARCWHTTQRIATRIIHDEVLATRSVVVLHGQSRHSTPTAVWHSTRTVPHTVVGEKKSRLYTLHHLSNLLPPRGSSTYSRHHSRSRSCKNTGCGRSSRTDSRSRNRAVIRDGGVVYTPIYFFQEDKETRGQHTVRTECTIATRRRHSRQMFQLL